MESYERLKSKKIDVVNLLEWHFTTICKSINKRLTFRQKYKNPWTIELFERVHRGVFIEAFKAIRDFTVEFGRTIAVTRDKKGVATKYIITFTHLGAFKHHLHKLSNLSKDNIAVLFKKTSDKGTAEVTVTEDKQSVIVYDCRSSNLKVTLSYTVTNKYGAVCSF